MTRGGWIAEKYLPHEADVRDRTDGRPWAGEPWPWCPMAARRDPQYPTQPVEEWPVVREALPHDGHIVNDGNTWCRGVPGTVPGQPIAGLEEEMGRRAARIADLRAQIEREERWMGDAEAALSTVKETLNG